MQASTSLQAFLSCDLCATGPDAPLDPIMLMKAVFLTLLSAMLQPLTMMALYFSDRRFFLLDLSDNLYSPLAYYVAHSIIGVPAVAIPAQVCFLTMYGFVGMRQTVAAIGYAALALALLNMLTFHLLLSYTYMLPNQDIATMSIISHMFITSLLAGFVVRLNHFNKFLLWFSYLFPGRYAMQIVMNTQVKVMPTLFVTIRPANPWPLNPTYPSTSNP
eukprot:jgi/Botrbrau1/7399/Bobra.0112s0001.2